MENKMNSQTAFQQSSETPIKCATGCGFFGTASTMNLCSKCYRDHRLKHDQSAAAIAAVGKSISSPLPPSSSASEDTISPKMTSEKSITVAEAVAEGSKSKKVANRCGCCNKKVGVVGFKCRCGSTFCGAHRYAEEHNCEFDYKVAARLALAKANPLVVADKLQRI